MTEELDDMTREEFEKEREEFEDAMSSLGKEIDRNVADTKELKRESIELKRESIRRRAELDQLDEMVKYLKCTVPTLISIITLVRDYLSDDYVGPTPTVEGLCLRILELHKKGMSND